MGVRASLVGCLLFLAGCGHSDQPACHPVKGRVLFEGKAIPDGQVVLHRIGRSLPVKPVGTTDAQGWFTVSTFGTDDGAPEGTYIVTVTWRQLLQVGEEKTRSGRNQLPAQYGNEKQSKLRCKITAGANELPTFELKR